MEMKRAVRYRLESDVGDKEVIKDRRGRVVDDRYVEEAVDDALETVRGRGRPSLSQSGESPLLRVRLSRDLDEAVRRAAERSGASRSDWVRRVLSEATRRAG
jgi:predicted HicB family RNase H-like nuclease